MDNYMTLLMSCQYFEAEGRTCQWWRTTLGGLSGHHPPKSIPFGIAVYRRGHLSLACTHDKAW